MINIAIDGPVGAGKSTIARECARRLGYIYVDTGALYRAIGLYCIENDSQPTASLSQISLSLDIAGGVQRVWLNGRDVSGDIRTPGASMMASAVSAVPEVRAFLLDLQRSLARKNDCIMDGRDIGTVILPDADVKIFLTAKPEIRARRRFDELTAKGQNVIFADVLAELNQRDYNDSHRTFAPLKQAEDAVLLDTSALDFAGSVAAVIAIINQKRQ